MVLRGTPAPWVHSFLNIAVLNPWNFSKTGDLTPGTFPKPDTHPLGTFNTGHSIPGSVLKPGIQPLKVFTWFNKMIYCWMPCSGHWMVSYVPTHGQWRRTGIGKNSPSSWKQGKVQDEAISKAQSKTNSALLNSLNAGFSLFTTNLENDQLNFKRWMLASSGDEAKARAAVVSSLEEFSCKTKFGNFENKHFSY